MCVCVCMCMCVLALVTQYTNRIFLHHVIFSSVACLAVQYFPTLSHKRHDFRIKNLNIKCVLIFNTNFTWKVSHSKRIRRHIIMHLHMSSRKVPVILSFPILIKRVFSTDTKFHENQSSWDRIVPNGQTDRQTDRQTGEANNRFSEFRETA